MLPRWMPQWQGAEKRAAELDRAEILRSVTAFQEVMFDDDHGYLDRLPEDVEANLLPVVELLGSAAATGDLLDLLVTSRLLRDTASGVPLPQPLRAVIDALPA
ncbi:hypothetical protein [Catellatospora sichuanensis]|uniref:hypothetical protein n=1 Tax=Catellatospora sichuanensis TaxID=1969805 RepID=UPI001181FA83|nr:hypothetical protein [Catellatospora sichuanensis]